jgi:hypothetical protein
MVFWTEWMVYAPELGPCNIPLFRARTLTVIGSGRAEDSQQPSGSGTNSQTMPSVRAIQVRNSTSSVEVTAGRFEQASV